MPVEDLTDGLGARHANVDGSGHATEILTLAKPLVNQTCFEFAVRERVLRLSELNHPSFPRVLGVDRVALESLAITTAAAEGVRLSEIVGQQASASFPWCVHVLGRLVHALAALHRVGSEIAHGAVSLHRVRVTRNSEVVVCDYVLGSALEQLGYSPDRYLTDLDVALPDGCGVFDYKVDLFQAALVGLELFAGRRLADGERRRRPTASDVRAAWPRATEPGGERAALEHWFARALQLSAAFDSPDEACEAIDAITSRLTPADTNFVPPIRVVHPAPAETVEASTASTTRVHAVEPSPEDQEPRNNAASSTLSTEEHHVASIAPLVSWRPQQFARDAQPGAPLFAKKPFQSTVVAVVATVALGAFSLAESKRGSAHSSGSALPARVSRESGATVPATNGGGNVSASTSDRGVASNVQTRTVPSPPSGANPTAASMPTAISTAGADASPEPPPTGVLTITSPIQFEALEHGRLVADSDSRRATLRAGPHDLEFVNDALKFRVTRRVNVAAHRTTTLALEAPVRPVAINADPWADIIVDGTPVGQTPLGRVPIAIGVHEMVFRHPSLGERRLLVSVPFTGEVRVSVRMK